MGKAQLRAEIRARRAIGHVPGADFVPRVLARIPARSRVCCYVGLPGEPPTGDVVEALLARGDAVFLPVAEPDRQMNWVNAAGSEPWAAWGLPGQPACSADRVGLPSIEVVVVPALAVTLNGQRLGQGGGYYDRFLPQQPQARTLALVWSDEIVDEVFAQPHDVHIDEWVAADG
ncbi:MAG: 5-formyltetrahydrofolate cyclo-ligase [Candidatus Nanopelagicales bacterium]